MEIKRILALTLLLPLISGQLYYPDDNGNVQAEKSGPILQINATQLTEVRGSAAYTDYVDRIISQGILNLTLAIQRAIERTSPPSDTVVYAPVSIAGVLALVLLGSNGRTFNEVTTLMGLAHGVDIEHRSQIIHEQFGRMIKQLQATSGFDIGKQVKFASAIFLQNGYPIRRIYKETAESLYQSEILNIDFGKDPQIAQQTINAWVSERTSGKITQLLADSPSPATKVILASAMYFKAEWEKPFFDGATKQRPFYTNGRKAKSEAMVEMMANGGVFPYYHDLGLDCEVLGFPYKGNQTTMYVVMPNESNTHRLRQLEARLSVKDMLNLVENVKYTRTVVVFPKMRIESTVDLKKSLQLMGLNSLFSPAQANLALLSPGIAALNNRHSAGVVENPIAPKDTDNDILIFSRTGEIVNCTDVFDNSTDVSTCSQVEGQDDVKPKVASRINAGRRILGGKSTETIDSIRQKLNEGVADPDKVENPGLYADNVIHKVFMDITESGTEAAASTSVSLSRDGGRVVFRVDVPFFFFILHEQTKTVLFWGSVNTPVPSYK